MEVLHLERVVRPPQSKRHPLAGLWKADYGFGGVQIIRITYDFTGPAARIVAIKVSTHPPLCALGRRRERVLKLPFVCSEACWRMQGQGPHVLYSLSSKGSSSAAPGGDVHLGDREDMCDAWRACPACSTASRVMHAQVTGDDHVPAGKHTWHAAAAPLKRPWATAEASLVDMQGQLLLQQAAGDEEEAMLSHKMVSLRITPAPLPCSGSKWRNSACQCQAHTDGRPCLAGCGDL